ncbi:unnamed protein product [Miscanthus lutarioriparius]|uniref:Uncharacterized protein n=1 Tax=Miscanthus lutarioriparius TaxID=422564 RepID=A0A811NH33_9POAL|nr:unnamed protein product [Miscanthus lutarioriparius]
MKDSGTKKPRELGERVIDHRFHPRLWILLTEPAPEATPTRQKLLNVTTRKIKVDLPEPDGHAALPGPDVTSEGMRVVRKRTLVMCLLNHLTCHVFDLSTLRTLQPGSRRGPIPDEFHEDHEVTGVDFVGPLLVTLSDTVAGRLVLPTFGGGRCRVPPGWWDVADFMRFCLVCKLWMNNIGTKKPHELCERVIDHRFHPHRWILMMEPAPEATPTGRKLLNITTQKIIKVDQSELDGHAMLLGVTSWPATANGGEHRRAPSGWWDVVDFMRFHLVCKLWMKGSSTKKPRELSERVIDHLFHPHRWILLMEPAPEATPTRRKLLHVTTRKIIMVDLPELDGHAVLSCPDTVSEGMLVVHERTLVMCLLNLLTHHVVDLPTLRTL